MARALPIVYSIGGALHPPAGMCSRLLLRGSLLDTGGLLEQTLDGWSTRSVPEPTPGYGAPPATHHHRATARRGRLPPPPRDTRPYACTSQVRPLCAGWLGNQPGPIARPEGATGGSTVAARGRCVEVVFLPLDLSALQILWRSRKCSTPLGAVRGAAAGAERRGRLRLMPGGGVAPASTPLARAAARRSSRSVCGACVPAHGWRK